MEAAYKKEKESQPDYYEMAKEGYKISPYPISIPNEKCQTVQITKMMERAGDKTPIPMEKIKFEKPKNEAGVK